MITTTHLSRDYIRKVGKGLFSSGTRVTVPAVQNLSFSIAIGESVAFIGPNGAGKTTTLRMLSGLLFPTSGEAEVAGFTPWVQRKELARVIGLVFGQRSQLWFDLPVIESFHALSVIYDLSQKSYRSRLQDLIDTLDLSSFVKQQVRSLSLGQRMRCEIAAALLHAPKVLFLDEPTIGLDVEAKAILRDYLKKLNEREKTTLLLTSHDTGDIEDICQRVIMIDHGRKLLDQPLSLLQKDFDSGRRLVVSTHEPAPCIDWPTEMIEETGSHRFVLNIDTREMRLSDAIARLQSSVDIQDLVIERTSLETIIRHLYANGGKGGER